MNAPENPTTAELLVEALRVEAERIMPTIDDEQQLARFQAHLPWRRRRAMALIAVGVAATAVVAVAATVAVTRNLGSAAQPVGPGPSSATSPATVDAEPTVAAPSPLPGSVKVARLANGPAIVAFDAFGAVWGLADPRDASTGRVFRVALDGSRVLSRTSYASTIADLPPFRVGNVVLVPAKTAAGQSYLAFGPDGRQVGAIPVQTAGSGAGDASGGWAQSGPNTLVHLGTSGTDVVGHVTLAGALIATVAVGGGSVWVGDSTGMDVIRLDARTGDEQGRVHLNEIPQQLAWGPHGVYVGTQSYTLIRLDPTTLARTAETIGDYQGSWFVSTIAPDGTVWAEDAQGTIAQLDPTTLQTMRSIQLFETLGAGGTFGSVVTQNRVFKSDGDRAVLYSFPLE